MISKQITLAHYRFTLEALEPLSLPPFKTSALRGGFGHCFKRLICQYPHQCIKRCQAGNQCPYGYVFETGPPADTPILKKFSDIPRPFILVDSGNRRTRIETGERLTFGLTLMGQAIKLLPHFVAVFHQLGRVGLGKAQGQYRLVQVEGLNPYTQARESIFQADDGLVYGGHLTVTGEAITTQAVAYGPIQQLTIQFLTPTQLKERGSLIQQSPPFFVLIKTLLNRLEALSLFHCGYVFEVNFAQLINQARAVALIVDETYQESWSRRSGRQQQSIKMDGLVGKVTYAGEITPFLPLLLLGELIHIGKKTVFGNGQYRLEAYSSSG